MWFVGQFESLKINFRRDITLIAHFVLMVNWCSRTNFILYSCSHLRQYLFISLEQICKKLETLKNRYQKGRKRKRTSFNQIFKNLKNSIGNAVSKTNLKPKKFFLFLRYLKVNQINLIFYLEKAAYCDSNSNTVKLNFQYITKAISIIENWFPFKGILQTNWCINICIW